MAVDTFFGAGGTTFDFGDFDLGDIFGGLFNRGRTAQQQPQRGQRGNDVEVEVRVSFEDSLQGAQVTVPVQLELASNEAIRTAVETGRCAAAISDLVVEKAVAADRLFVLDGELAKRSFYALRHKERHVSKVEAALMASLASSP